MAESRSTRSHPWAVILIGVAAVVVALGAYYLRSRVEEEKPAQCEVCHRPIMPGTDFSVSVDGHEVHYCCPRCWVTSLRTQGEKYQRPLATDYVSGKTIPAGQCVYVEGSDVAPCCDPHMTRGKDNVPAVLCYDRCSPSVIAFASSDEALRFTEEHGGTIIPFETLADEAKKP